MKILWFTWKDGSNPAAGGAETVNEELAKRLVRDGHAVTFVVAGFNGGAAEESRDGCRILRVGNRWSVYLRAHSLYRKSLQGTADLVIDEINTVPFFCRWYVREKNILFVHQLAREIWFHEMLFPLNVVGYVLEPLYLRMLSDRAVVTVSESSKRDLLRRGFRPERVRVIPEGVAMEPLGETEPAAKNPHPTLLAFGAIRSMKRTMHALRIFELAKRELPDLQLIVAGAAHGAYGAQVVDAIKKSPYAGDIRCLGRVDAEEKKRLFTAAHLLLATSCKEGWGLVVTEADRRGTPAVVYDVDGLRDSVRHDETGIVVPDGDASAAARAVVRILKDEHDYARLRSNALAWAKTLDFDASYAAFVGILKSL
jgi:glycosyltransferase involved in cell wall biosynthesis